MDKKQELVLIVDDNLRNLEVLGRILKEEGFLIGLTQSGKETLEQLESLRPDLILLDVMMPDMSGYDLCRIIKQNDKLKDIPVIFVSAKTQTEDLVEGFNAGGVDFITKPFHRNELMVRIRSQLELASSKRRIIELNRSRDKMYSIIAHDIRSPFSNIKMVINLLACGVIVPGSEEYASTMKTLDKVTKSTSIMLNNLLDWTRNQSGTAVLSPKSLKIHPILSECITLLQGNALYKEITVHLDVDTDIEAYFDEVTMHTVFRNLLSNAVKFTPENGSIRFHSQVKDEYLVVSVEDSGVGMSEEAIHRLFEKKEHYTSLGTRDEKGSGFGLIMVRDFIDQNKGKLEVESTLGKGTTFSVYVPLSK